MSEDDIRKVIFSTLKKIAPDTTPEQLGPDDNIRTTLGIDSFDYLQFIIGLDETLGVQTPEEDYGKIESMRALLNYIANKKPTTHANT